jgi:hypothetical protein
MKRVLLLGYDPETVDFSDPALPPGMSVDKVHAGIEVALKQFGARGWEGDAGFIRPDETAGPTVVVSRGPESADYPYWPRLAPPCSGPFSERCAKPQWQLEKNQTCTRTHELGAAVPRLIPDTHAFTAIRASSSGD